MTECYACARLAELMAENSALRVRMDELTCNDALAPDKIVTPVGVVANDANVDSRELLPCPFCGGEARHYAPGLIDHHIECVECYADIHRDTEAEAIAAWNTRAELGSEREKALEELVRDMWHEMVTCPDYATSPCMTNSICERVRNLEIKVI